jgi:flavin reductase (DIM6/NTAB) family NADH-FMN oxidoreductase RutF
MSETSDATVEGHEAPDLRQVMGHFPAGITVVTAFGSDGKPRGLTVTAFCAVSLIPPLVLACIDKGSNTLEALLDAQAFTVNFLSADAEPTALLFASKQEDKFDGRAFRLPKTQGAGPILVNDALAHMECRVREVIEAGDHMMFLGAVVETDMIEGRNPLVYCRRTFAAWDDLAS